MVPLETAPLGSVKRTRRWEGSGEQRPDEWSWSSETFKVVIDTCLVILGDGRNTSHTTEIRELGGFLGFLVHARGRGVRSCQNCIIVPVGGGAHCNCYLLHPRANQGRPFKNTSLPYTQQRILGSH